MIRINTAAVEARRSRRGGAVVVVAVAMMLAGGCGSGDGLDRQAVRGRVTLDGEPLARGSILFEPATDDVGTAVGGTIRDGRFAIARADGPVPGNYLVRIYASTGTQAPPPEGGSAVMPRPMVERVPGRYNANTVLRAEIPPGGPGELPFDLVSAAP